MECEDDVCPEGYICFCNNDPNAEWLEDGGDMTVPTLSMWASNVAFVPGHEGWMLDAVTDRLTGSTILGESVLDQFGLEVGDVVSGIDSTISLLSGREATWCCRPTCACVRRSSEHASSRRSR